MKEDLDKLEKEIALFGSGTSDNSVKLSEPDELCSSLNEKQRAVVMDLVTVHNFSKGSMLRHEGEIDTTCYSIVIGCVRQYYVVDGEEKTTFFYTENQTIFRPRGFSSESPASHFLSCVEDTTLTCITRSNEQILFERCPEFQSLSRQSMEEEIGTYQEMLALYITSSPEGRYLNLLKHRPELLNRVPQYMLASYLGVRPESLSRIRKRIVLK